MEQIIGSPRSDGPKLVKIYAVTVGASDTSRLVLYVGVLLG